MNVEYELNWLDIILCSFIILNALVIIWTKILLVSVSLTLRITSSSPVQISF